MPQAINVHARFYGLLRHFPHMTKEDLVWQYSGMLTTSLSDFYQKKPEAYYAMVSEMQKIANKMEAEKPKNELTTASTVGQLATPKDHQGAAALGVTVEFYLTEIKKGRSDLLTAMTKYGFKSSNTGKAFFDDVNKFLKDRPRLTGKDFEEFMKMGHEELRAAEKRIYAATPWRKAKDAMNRRLEAMN